MMDAKYLITRQGKEMVLYPGLLDAAHQRGLKRVSTLLVQIPGPENGYVAICTAEVEVERGTFTGIGDASPENVGKMVANALIRMAETRAKARAFRDALNVGELLADDPTTEEEPEADAAKRIRALGWIKEALKELRRREVDVAQFGQCAADDPLPEIEAYGRTLKAALARTVPS